jgi:uncharacterized cupredoxin-like copper-binding protein
MRKQFGALILGAALTVTSACGVTTVSSGQGASVAVSAPASAAGTQQVTMTVGNSMHFAPATLAIRAGQPVELTLRNSGGLPHDFTLAEGASRPVKIEALGGQTGRGTFTIDTPGTYEFVCSVSGHAAAGMRGSITVS